jgi:SAM-dependent methyltransferase
MADVLHTNRARAESFGEDARTYHRVRPRYPAPLLDHLLDGATPAVLDVGCGTGIAAQLLVERGCSVLGVEPDERMAEVAREGGIEVEIGHIESWDPQGRTFDLVTSGQAWHWVDPLAGFPKAAGVLNDGGRIGLFWNFAQADEPVASALNEIYDRLAAELGHPSMMLGGNHAEHARIATDLRESGLFEAPQISEWTWRDSFTTARWVEQARTQSNHRTLAPERCDALLDAVAGAIDDHGGTVDVSYVTRLIEARRL